LRDFGKPLRKILTEAGCQFLRQGRGSHEIWITPGGKRFVVPVTIPSRELANKILKKDASLPKAF